MAFSRLRARSLRSQLLFWLLVPLGAVALLDAWITYRAALETATIVQERMLLGAARMIGEQVHLEDGALEVDIPPAALELFASPVQDRVFYRVSRAGGELLSGYDELPLPPNWPVPEEALFFDANQQGLRVHVVAFAQPVLTQDDLKPVLIQVAQTLEGRDELTRSIWGATARRQIGLLVLVSMLLWFGLRRGLRPLLQLRDRMLRRTPGTLDRLDARAAPTELQPLVGALNDYVDRLDRHMSAHSRFIADASHQLRTPLTLLNTQVVYAIRNSEPRARDEALAAIQASLQHSTRLVNQLLAFSMAETSLGRHPRLEPVDLAQTARRVLESLAVMAQQRRIDLGFERGPAAAVVQAVPRLLHELVANLIDNALRYTQEAGAVTVRVRGGMREVVLQVEDNGPGVPPDQREKVFERFHRLHDDRSDGCGLGLAIVREIATACGARVELATPAGGRGLLVTVTFPVGTPTAPP